MSREGVATPASLSRGAVSIRKVGQEAAFGDYVAHSMRAWEVWDPQRTSAARAAAVKIRARSGSESVWFWQEIARP